MTKHFFDIGANIGQTFDDFLCKRDEFDGATVWCFEPSPRHVIALLEKTKRLQQRFRINVCPFAVAGFQSVRRFWLKDDPRGDSLFEHVWSDHDQRNIETDNAVFVSCVPITEFILQHTTPVDEITLKLDAEGAEYEILTALLGSAECLVRVKRILVEWHSVENGGAGWHHPRERMQEAYGALAIELEKWQF